MKNTDVVLQALIELQKALPQSMQYLVVLYEEKGIDGLDEAWDMIIKEAINENS